MKKKIVYIDQEIKYRNKAKQAFAKHHYEYVLCRNAKVGLQEIKNTLPDVVIVDYHLPDSTGEELYTQFITHPDIYLKWQF